MSSLTAFESCLSMPQPTGAGRPAAFCAWTRTACLSGRLSVSRGPSTLPYLLLLSLPRHTSSLSSSHALSSTLRRKTLSRLLSASPISTQKGLSCPRYTRYPASQPIPITSGPIQFPPTNPEAPLFCDPSAASGIVPINGGVDGLRPLCQVLRVVGNGADVLEHELQCGAMLATGLAVSRDFCLYGRGIEPG